MSKRKLPEEAKLAHARRMYIHQHNGLVGAVAMSKANMERIIRSVSTTQATKEHAQWLIGQIEELEALIKVRVDHFRP